MTNRALLSLFLIAILTSASIPYIHGPGNPRLAQASTEAPNENAIAIKSLSTRYDSGFEAFHVFGELVNNLETPVQNVRLNVTFYNQQGNLTGSIVSSPYFRELRPGEKSAFDMVAKGDAASILRDFAYYKISRTWEETTEQKEGLLRLDLRNITLDPCGYYRIEGTVTNLAREPTSGIVVSGAFYNEQYQIVATAFTAIKERLDPTKNDQFTFVVEEEALPHFAYYSFNVRSDQYGSATIEGEEDLSNFHSLTPAGGKIMAVVTESPSYTIDQDRINVSGQVPLQEVAKRESNSLIVIKILTGSGLVPVLVTARVADDGTFSREIEFQMDENMQGQVFRIRAEYFGIISESTFAVVHDIDTSESEPSCTDLEKVSISELYALLGDSGGGNITDFLSGREFKLGTNVTLSALVDNEISRVQNITVIFEIFDSEDVVEFLHVAEGQLAPNDRNELRAYWLPMAKGTFLIKTFAISTLDQPVLLSLGPPLSVNIVE